MKVYVYPKEFELSEALEILTDDYISGGNLTHQTTMDLRDAVKELLKENEVLINLARKLQERVQAVNTLNKSLTDRIDKEIAEAKQKIHEEREAEKAAIRENNLIDEEWVVFDRQNFLQRLKVFGGWLVMYDDTAMCFVPDKLHLWGKKLPSKESSDLTKAENAGNADRFTPASG